MGKNKIFLITSGAYANAEIASDFGLLPPTFLPIGHKRLIELQIEMLQDYDVKKYITLPDNFDLLERDSNLLNKNNFNIYRNNPNLTLSQSILSFLNSFKDIKEIDELYILHGDTSFKEIIIKPDLLYYGFTDMFYKWGNLEDVVDENLSNDIYKKPVLAGYFSFSNTKLFKEELKRNNSFENSLRNYNQKIKFNTVLKSGWLDFGHSNLYYKSKMKLNVARSFNQVIANVNFIKKTSNNLNKIESEYKWFKQVPKSLNLFTPNVWSFKQKENIASYKIEFIGAPTLQEKWVFGNLPDFVYFNIIDQIFSFIRKSKKIKFKEFNNSLVKENFKELYIEKTQQRVIEFSKQLQFNIEQPIFINNKKYPPLKTFSLEVLKILNEQLDNIEKLMFTFMHGDLCFSNILTDSRSNLIKVIDPRGGLNNNFNSKNKIIGDFRYDIAKLGHSLIGNYDYIVTGFYNLSIKGEMNFDFSLQHEKRDDLKKYYFEKVEELNVNSIFIHASIVNLFISMLPLHSDDKNRQVALLLNAYQLFYD